MGLKSVRRLPSGDHQANTLGLLELPDRDESRGACLLTRSAAVLTNPGRCALPSPAPRRPVPPASPPRPCLCAPLRATREAVHGALLALDQPVVVEADGHVQLVEHSHNDAVPIGDADACAGPGAIDHNELQGHARGRRKAGKFAQSEGGQ